jgi:uncharacterized protein (TIGR02246 family)
MQRCNTKVTVARLTTPLKAFRRRDILNQLLRQMRGKEMILDKTKFVSVFVAGIVGTTLLGFLLSPANAESTQIIAAADESESPIRQTIGSLEKALASSDEKAVAALWTDDGIYVDADGNVTKGRDALEKRFAIVFKIKGGQLYEVTPESVQVVAPNAARAIGSVKPKGAGTAPETRFLMMLVNKDGKWLISTASEISATPSPANGKDAVNELGWLVGKWKAERNGAFAQMTAEWIANKNFIHCKFEINKPNQAPQTDYQIIGWDAERDQLTFWAFLDNGGHGYGTWFRRGDKWLVESNAVDPDGGMSRAINVIEPTNPNSFVWQSINRSINGIAVADSAPLKVDRINQ